MAKQRPATKRQNGGGNNGNGSNGGAKRGGNTGQPARRTPRAGASRRSGRRSGGATGSVNTWSGQTQTISGYDYITNVTAPYALSETTSRLVDVPMTPTALAGTRWSQLATMYEKYRFTSCQMCYVPAVASIVGGQVISYWELDPTDPFGASGNLNQDLRVAMAHQNAKLHNVYDNVSVAMPLRTGISDFFVERAGVTDNPRWSRQATYRVIASAGLTGFLNHDVQTMVIGSIYMKWTCMFKNPQIQPSLIVPVSTLALASKPCASDVLSNMHTPTTDTTATIEDGQVSWFNQDGQTVKSKNYSRNAGAIGFGNYEYKNIVGTAVGTQYSYTVEQYKTRIAQAMYVVRGAPIGTATVIYSKTQIVWIGPPGSTSPSDVGVMELTLERFVNGYIALFQAVGTSGTVSVPRDIIVPATPAKSRDYGIPNFLVNIASGVKYAYGFVQDNAESISGAFNIIKDLAFLIASFGDAIEVNQSAREMLAIGMASSLFVASPMGFDYHPDNHYRCLRHANMLTELNKPFACIDDEPDAHEQ